MVHDSLVGGYVLAGCFFIYILWMNGTGFYRAATTNLLTYLLTGHVYFLSPS